MSFHRTLFRLAILLALVVPSAAMAGAEAKPADQAADKAANKSKPKSDPAAEALMLRAHQARSGWDEKFPGFSADVTVTLDGDQHRGKVSISADGEVELDLDDDKANAWAQRQLSSIAMHRFSNVRDKYDVSFADNIKNHPLGRLIKFHGGTTHSVYRINDDVITEVHRQMKGVRFTISVTKVARNAEGKTLPSHFNVSFWEPAGNLTANEDYQEDWIAVGGYDLPRRRLLVKTAKDARQVYELKLDNHKLAKPDDAAGE